MSLRFKPDLKKQPPGGWHFIIDGQTLRGSSPEDVAAQVRAYRIRNGQPLGEPLRELIEFCARHWPHLVHQGEPPPEVPVPTLLSRLHQWLAAQSRLAATASPPVEEVAHREELCRQCPFNQPVPKLPADLAGDVEMRSFLLRRGRRAAGVGACAFHSWDNRVACARPLRLSKPESDPPPYCWVVKPYSPV